MAYVPKTLIFVALALCALTASFAQNTEDRRRVPTSGRPSTGNIVLIGAAAHGIHGNSHTHQSGNHSSQGNSQENLERNRREIQGGDHVDQGTIHSSQSGPHESQGGPHISQGGPHENQIRVRRQASQAGPHDNQGGTHSSEGRPHENQGRVRRQVEQNQQYDVDGDTQISQDSERQSNVDIQEVTVVDEFGIPVWVPCTATIIPRLSCYDCNTRMICKNVGGLLKHCGSGLKPYCNRGICSSTPSTECTVNFVPYKQEQDSQNITNSLQVRPHEEQGRVRRQAAQGGPHDNQGGTHPSQVRSHGNQGRVRRQASQGGPHDNQGVVHSSQGEVHENKGRVRRQTQQNGHNDNDGDTQISRNNLRNNDDEDQEVTILDEFGMPVWVPCNASIIPRISCYNCNTRVICTDVGGLMKHCGSSNPFCNRGICSSTPSAECTSNPNAECSGDAVPYAQN